MSFRGSLEGKRLLILDGTQLGCEIVREAKRMGVHAIVTDYNPPDKAPAKKLADDYFMVSTTDVDEVVKLIQRENIDGVIAGFSDLMLPYYAQICERAGLPCYGNERLFRLFTDKLAYKKLCIDHGVPTIQGYVLEDFQGSRNLNVRFPVIVKPADGSGSRGVTICRSSAEILAAVLVAEVHSPRGEVLIEQYIDGQEATVFWTFQDGEYYLSAMANRHVKHNQADELPLPVGYSMPSCFLENYERAIAPNVRRMLRAAGVRDGMMFMQGLIDDGVFRVYDIGYRLTGTQEYRLLEHLSGFNPLSMMINLALTRSMGESLLDTKANPHFAKYAYNVSILMRPGTISRFEGIEAVRERPGVISVVKAHAEGDTLPQEAIGQLRQIAVRVQGTAESLSGLEQTMLYITNKIKIIEVSGEDLTLQGIGPGDLGGLLH